jgi:crotonobetainyl-CoA:carnitine CoA-transferase CaiB-like acyl-CoA transferase
VRRAGPLMGEHNDYVLGEILGLSRDEIERLEREGVLN